MRQEEVLFAAPEADVDDDVCLTDLGRLKDLDAELLLALLVGLLARDRVPVVQELAVLLEHFQEALEQVVLARNGTRERRGEVSHGETGSFPQPREAVVSSVQNPDSTVRGEEVPCLGIRSGQA